MAVFISTRKRYAATTETELTKLQATISIYAARHHADQAHRELAASRLQVLPQVPTVTNQLEGFISYAMDRVDELMSLTCLADAI